MKTIKNLLFLYSLVSLTLSSICAEAAHAVKQKANLANSDQSEKPSVGTDFKFDDMTVRGQYQSANEGLVTVENEKELKNLLDYRTDYKDRLNASRLNP